jgi:hypothetical protein
MKLIGKSRKNANVETLRARYLELLRLREFVQRLEDQFQATALERFRTAPQYKPRGRPPPIYSGFTASPIGALMRPCLNPARPSKPNERVPLRRHARRDSVARRGPAR